MTPRGSGSNPSVDSSVYKSWRRAVRAVERELRATAEAPDATAQAQAMLAQWEASVPAQCKPYDLRHSFGTDAYAKSGDVYAVKALMQHADIKTTETYIKAAVPERVTQAIDKMRDAWFPNAPKPAAGPARVFHLVDKTGA